MIFCAGRLKVLALQPMLFPGFEVELWCFSDFWWVLTEWVFLFVFGYSWFNVSGQDTMELSQPASQMPNAPLIGIIQPRREEKKKKKNEDGRANPKGVFFGPQRKSSNVS
jgi:hypothetical protein